MRSEDEDFFRFSYQNVMIMMTRCDAAVVCVFLELFMLM